MSRLKSILTTSIAVFALGFVAFWVQFDVVRAHATYSTYLNVNALYCEVNDFGFTRAPLFWVFLFGSTIAVFGLAGALGYAVGRSLLGVLIGGAVCVAVHLTARYIPRLPEVTWEYNVAFGSEAVVAIASAFVGGRIAEVVGRKCTAG